MYKDFKDMDVWQKAMKIAENVFEISEHLPRKEDYGLTSQIRRAALSISSNITEAFGRYHKKEKINFYYFARGSLLETKNHLEYGKRVGYFSGEQLIIINKLLDEVYFELNKIIKTLNK